MKIFASPAARRLAKFQQESEIRLSESDLRKISQQEPFEYADVVELYNALPEAKRNKAYFELLLKSLKGRTVLIKAAILVLKEQS